MMKSLSLVILTALGILAVNTAQADSAKLINPANNHSYQRFDSVMTWHTAKQACESKGGYLASSTSVEENNFIISNFVLSPPVEWQGFWMGASDEAQEGVWKWVTGEPWNYTSWADGQPVSFAGNTENYLNLLYFPRGSIWEWAWNDGHDTDAIQSYLCEWDSAPTATITPIKNCTIINAPGKYRLTTNLVSTSGGCLIIAANNVTLDLNNRTIQGGDGTAPSTWNTGTLGILAQEVSNLKIFNGVIQGFGVGVNFLGVTNTLVEKIMITNNNVGSFINANFPTANIFSSGNKFISNVITQNAGHGISVNGGASNTFQDNTITNNGGVGLLLYNGNGNKVLSNAILGNSREGIYVDSSYGSDQHAIKNNIVRGNYGLDLRDDNSLCASDVWLANNFGKRSQSCIR